MSISASTKLLFGIIKRLLYMVNSEAGKKIIESDKKKKVLIKPEFCSSLHCAFCKC